MSTRNIRKIFGTAPLVPSVESDDEEYEPPYATRTETLASKYQGLSVSSDSEAAKDQSDLEASDDAKTEDEPKPQPKKKNNKKKKKRNQQRKKNSDSVDDEVERSVKEVNELLGAPKAAAPSAAPVEVDREKELLSVQYKYLNADNEMTRLFGPDDDAKKSRPSKPHERQNRYKRIIVPIVDHLHVNMESSALSMSVERRADGNNYFMFDHSREYQKHHRFFVSVHNAQLEPELRRREVLRSQMEYPTAEGHLEVADYMFTMEQYAEAKKSLEYCIFWMQAVAIPSFNPALGRTRLEYKCVENRPFHIAILKYLYLLSNTACHRTALELAKMLLILDPSDPLAVILVIDVLALRAREHQWLIDLLDCWGRKRDAWFLYNFVYSRAMAQFHIAKKTKDPNDMALADSQLQDAMMKCPLVVKKILECCNTPSTAPAMTHILFNGYAEKYTTICLKELINLYAKLVHPRWREPPVMEWLLKNAAEVMAKYDNDQQIKDRVKKYGDERLALFRVWPLPIHRHLAAIAPMADLLEIGTMPDVGRHMSADPLPPLAGVDRYGYYRNDEPADASWRLLRAYIEPLLEHM